MDPQLHASTPATGRTVDPQFQNTWRSRRRSIVISILERTELTFHDGTFFVALLSCAEPFWVATLCAQSGFAPEKGSYHALASKVAHLAVRKERSTR